MFLHITVEMSGSIDQVTSLAGNSKLYIQLHKMTFYSSHGGEILCG